MRRTGLTPPRSILIILIGWLALPGSCDLTSAIDEIVARDEFSHGFVGVAVYDPATGEALYEHNAQKAMQPASTMKTVSCAFALETLGPHHRFRTKVVAGAPVDGVIAGDVYLVGCGYPFTYASTFKGLADAIAEAGITRIGGAVVADVSRFEGSRWRSGWTADDFLYYYGALPDAIMLNRNRVYFTVKPTAVGEPAEVTHDIPEASFWVINEAVTVEAEGKTSLWIGRSLESNKFTVTGTIAADAEPEEIRRAFVDPGLTAAEILTAALREKGVTVGREPTHGEAPEGAVEIAGADSAELIDALEVILKFSDNQGAELMVWTTGTEADAGPRFSDCMAMMSKWLDERGMPMEALRLSDGSGLSRYDYLTARFLARHLCSMTESPNFEAFKKCLPVAGVDGTLTNRFKGGIVEGKVSAKTGSLSRVAGLAGYAPRDDGSQLVFATFFNAFDCPRSEVYTAQEDIMEAIMTEELPASDPE